jgi:hypothetical protein
MANLQRILLYYDPLDQELQDRLALLERRLGQAALNPRAEGAEIVQHFLGAEPFLAQAHPLFLLLAERVPALLQVLPPLGQLLQRDHFGLVGIEQAPLFALQPVKPRGHLVPLRLFLRIAFQRRPGTLLELVQQAIWLTQQLHDMLPYGGLQLRGLDRPPRTGLLPRAQDTVLPVAVVVAPLRLGAAGLVRHPEHRQPAHAAGQ